MAYMGPGGSCAGGVCCELILPNGLVAVLDFEADPTTQRFVSIEDFEDVPAEAESEEVLHARNLLRTEGEAFDARVLKQFKNPGPPK